MLRPRFLVGEALGHRFCVDMAGDLEGDLDHLGHKFVLERRIPDRGDGDHVNRFHQRTKRNGAASKAHRAAGDQTDPEPASDHADLRDDRSDLMQDARRKSGLAAGRNDDVEVMRADPAREQHEAFIGEFAQCDLGLMSQAVVDRKGDDEVISVVMGRIASGLIW